MASNLLEFLRSTFTIKTYKLPQNALDFLAVRWIHLICVALKKKLILVIEKIIFTKLSVFLGK